MPSARTHGAGWRHLRPQVGLVLAAPVMEMGGASAVVVGVGDQFRTWGSTLNKVLRSDSIPSPDHALTTSQPSRSKLTQGVV